MECGNGLARMTWSRMILSGHGLSRSTAAPRIMKIAAMNRLPLMRNRFAKNNCRMRGFSFLTANAPAPAATVLTGPAFAGRWLSFRAALLATPLSSS